MFASKHRKYKLFPLVNRRVVPGLSRLSKSLCVQSLCAFLLPYKTPCLKMFLTHPSMKDVKCHPLITFKLGCQGSCFSHRLLSCLERPLPLYRSTPAPNALQGINLKPILGQSSESGKRGWKTQGRETWYHKMSWPPNLVALNRRF